jgi:uncharacterized protein YkwD
MDMRYNRHIIATCLVLGATLAGSAPALAAPSRATNLCNAATAARVVTATNQYRSSLGLPQLQVTPKLVVFASLHARDMASHAVLTHSSSTGLSFSQRAHGSSYRFSSLRENVAVEGGPLPTNLGFNVFDLWRHSPPHDANMRAKDVSQIGVAVSAGPGGCYASMDLGHPLT